MKKFEITIKDTSTGEVQNVFNTDSIIMSIDNSNLIAGEFDTAGMLTLLATLIESVTLSAVQKDNIIKAHNFSELKDLYEPEPLQRVQEEINQMLRVLTEAVSENMDENINGKNSKKSKSYKIQVLNENNKILRERTADFGIVSCYDSGISLYYNLKEPKEIVENKLFQTVCNTLDYAAKLSLALTSNSSVEDIDKLLEQGNDNAYKELMIILENYLYSLKEHHKTEHLTNKLTHNKLDYIIDEEEFMKQAFSNSLNKLLNNEGEDEEDDE